MKIIVPALTHTAALSELMGATFTETFGHLYPPADLARHLGTAYAHDVIAGELADSRNFWQLVLDDDGTAVAYLQCIPAHLPHPDLQPDRDGEIGRIYVRSSQQGQGLGKRLMSIAVAHLGDRYGTAPQWLGVWSENLKAQALYRSFGFDKVGEYDFPVGETRDLDFIFRRISILP